MMNGPPHKKKIARQSQREEKEIPCLLLTVEVDMLLYQSLPSGATYYTLKEEDVSFPI